MKLAIKPEFAQRVMAFDGSGSLPVGQYSIERLIKLAIIAQQSKDKTLLDMFEGPLPSVQELQRAQLRKALKK